MRGGNAQGANVVQVLLRRVWMGTMRKGRLEFVGVCTKLAQSPTRTGSRRPRRLPPLTAVGDLVSCDTWGLFHPIMNPAAREAIFLTILDPRPQGEKSPVSWT